MKRKSSSSTSSDKPARRPQGSDLERLARMKPEEIDLSDAPEVSLEEFARGVVVHGLKPPARKTQITLRLDSDVLEWFKAKGKGYQVEMNALLRAYVEAHKKAG